MNDRVHDACLTQSTQVVATFSGVGLRYGKVIALSEIDLQIPAGCMVGLIGPDGVGKSSMLSLLAGARAIQSGQIKVLDGDISAAEHRNRICPRIAYMPQGLGKNLYPTLSVEENLQFFGRLFGHNAKERRRRIDKLTSSTGLLPFLDRPAGKLSGGMKQKLGLCCALIHDPELLILDEPTTGVDPLSRSQFWDLIAHIRSENSGMSVIVATAYMEEAERFDWLVAMDAGKVLATGSPLELRTITQTTTLDDAFIAMLPEEKRRDHQEILVPPMCLEANDVAIEAQGLTMRFGDFTAVDDVDFRIRRGEIFGFLGSNGCGKSTTMKMLTGLLNPSEGSALLFGRPVDSEDITIRSRVGYMSQSFSLYGELTVRQNLVLHARLFKVASDTIAARISEMAMRFGLEGVLDSLPETLPLGMRQRLSLAVAMVHKPELLILDEPTSGVDPVARDTFWQLMIALARKDGVTIFISTHFMNEAERCDRISLMHAGRVLVSDSPSAIIAGRRAATLEQAFIAYLQEALDKDAENTVQTESQVAVKSNDVSEPISREMRPSSRFSLTRALSYTLRETLELRRDPVRATLALLGTAILMFIIGYGISLDVQDLPYAVLDSDQTGISQQYALNLSGSRYFIEHAPIRDYADLDKRMRNGELALAIEIPNGFARNLERGRDVSVAAWIDGSMPTRAETIRGYVQAMHVEWLSDMAEHRLGIHLPEPARIETRFRYNPDVKSLPAMIPAVIPMLLMMIPAMLAALSVVREKELGSIINLYVTPVTRIEFLLGKQAPYVVLAMLNFALMSALAVTIFGVPIKGSPLTLTLAAFIFVIASTGFGLFASTFTRSQIAAMFVTMIGTLIPCVQFAGLLNPVSSLEGVGAWIGKIYPATHFLTISRGVFSKALDLQALTPSFWPLVGSLPIILAATAILLKKQES